MGTRADEGPPGRHTLSDWLALHELDPDACRDILDAAARLAESAPDGHRMSSRSENVLPDPEEDWRRTAAALRAFFPARQDIIDDAFRNTVRTRVERKTPPRALTLDSGAGSYPTILYSYLGKPSDALILAHEFAHALQIRASRGRFVAPIIREACAFIGEKALLAHALQNDASRFDRMLRVWQRDNRKYLGTKRELLMSVLSRPDTPYDYAWNYPLARYFAIQLAARCSPDRIWTLFEGDLPVRGVLRELDFAPAGA